MNLYLERLGLKFLALYGHSLFLFSTPCLLCSLLLGRVSLQSLLPLTLLDSSISIYNVMRM